MQITVNGEAQTLSEGATITDLITVMELTGKRIAVELNAEIVPRSEHSQTVLNSGDKVEVVAAVGGG